MGYDRGAFLRSLQNPGGLLCSVLFCTSASCLCRPFSQAFEAPLELTLYRVVSADRRWHRSRSRWACLLKAFCEVNCNARGDDVCPNSPCLILTGTENEKGTVTRILIEEGTDPQSHTVTGNAFDFPSGQMGQTFKLSHC
jgi:hypothetical protein